MKKRLALVLISSGIIFASAFGATTASWAVTDNADSFGVKIDLDVPHKEIGYYLKWNDGEEIKLGEKVDTELKTTVSVTTTGVQKFSVLDEKDTVITGGNGTITLDLLGDYSFCFRNGSTYEGGPSDNTYMYYNVYFTDTNSWGESNIKAYLYNADVNNGWPGNKDYSVSKVKDDDGYGHKVYKITPNANLYGSSGSNLILSNNGSDQTIDIDLCNAIGTTNTKGIYLNNQSTKLTVDTSSISWWKDANAKTYAYVFKDGGSTKWVEMHENADNNKVYTSDYISLSSYNKVIFVRTNPDAAPDFGWGQTVDLNIPTCVSASISFSYQDGGGKVVCGDWYNKKNGISVYDFIE